jgi:hypothetical protein
MSAMSLDEIKIVLFTNDDRDKAIKGLLDHFDSRLTNIESNLAKIVNWINLKDRLASEAIEDRY